MQTVIVTKTIPAPIEDVFDAYTDHERLADLPMVISAKVVVPGKTERNGLGAVREVNGGAIWLREEITAFERPTLMEYRIRRSRPPATHELGRVEFSEVPGGTEVRWKTVFGVRYPLIGSAPEPLLALLFRGVFEMTLRQVAKRATATSNQGR